MKTNRIVLVVFIMLAMSAVGAEAQSYKIWKPWSGNVAVGWVTPMGDADDILKDGWSFTGGATYHPRGWRAGIFTELSFSENKFNRRILDALEASKGDVSVTSLTTGITMPFETSGSVGFYLKGGIGAYYLKGRLKEPGIICGCDPWIWWYCAPICLPGDVTTDSGSTTKFGANLGLGMTFEMGPHSQFYFEATYHYIETRETTELMPISLGFRW